MGCGVGALDLFHPVVREWFLSHVGTPSAPQEEGWPLIGAGRNTLICAPTGAGKTLAAFLESINRLLVAGISGELPQGVFVLYVSPLKALNNDIMRNLDMPFDGIRAICSRQGIPFPDIRKAVRTGDTPMSERQRMVKSPPHILITTPESLYLMLTSPNSARMLSHVRYLIVDEIHSLVATKRGAHLTVSLERLETLCEAPPVRIGLSATVNPMSAAASFLGGVGREVVIAAPHVPRERDLEITLPVKDFRMLEQSTVWPEIYATVLRLIHQHTTTIVFVNNRATAEKIASNVNELAGEMLCRPHHGSISREVRLGVEEDFKQGRIRCMVATATLELGIDIGSVDLMIQISSPPSVASGLQRLGRAGHRLSAVSKGRVIPKTRGDLLKAAFLCREMNEGVLEECHPPENSLDVLSQHIVSMCCSHRWSEADMLAVVRGAWGYRSLTETDFRRVLAMLAGDYEHAADIPVKPRIDWDRINGVVAGTPYSRMLAVGAGGTIPDRGYFPVMMEDRATRVGELDEVFVFEARIGDVFMLGNSPWVLRRVERDRVIVSPSPTATGARVPFWQGDGIGSAYSQGVRFGAFLQTLGGWLEMPDFASRIGQLSPVEEDGAENIRQYLADQIDSVGCLSHHRRVVVEWSNDGENERNILIHAHFGGRVNNALALLLQDALDVRMRIPCWTSHTDDLILIHVYGCPDDWNGILRLLPRDNPGDRLLRLLPATPRFAVAFRYNAYRSLMMGSKGHSRRLPLWLQRLRSVDALENAQKHMDHPLIVETMRECMNEAFDVENLTLVLKGISSGEIAVVERQTWYPSPFASEVMLRYQGVMMYEELSSHPGTVNRPVVSGMDVLNLRGGPGEDLPDITREAADTVIERESALARSEGIGTAAELHSWLLVCGDADVGEWRAWSGSDMERELMAEGRIAFLSCDEGATRVQDGMRLVIAAEEMALYHAIGMMEGMKESSAAAGTWSRPDAIRRVFRRFARFRSPFTVENAAQRYGLSMRETEQTLLELKEEGFLIRLTLPGDVQAGWCHSVLFERIRRSSMNQEAAIVRAQPSGDFAALVPGFQHVTDETAIPQDKLFDVIRLLEGLPLPADQWESIVFPARVDRYAPVLLDRLCQGGRVAWRIHPGSARIPLLSWHLPDGSGGVLTPEPPAAVDLLFQEEVDAVDAGRILEVLGKRGASFTHVLTGATALPASRVLELLGRLVFGGFAVNDAFQPIRFFLEKAESKHPEMVIKRIAGMVSRMELGRWERLPVPGASVTMGTLRALGSSEATGEPGTLEASEATGEPGTLEALSVRVDRCLARYGLMSREVALWEELPWDAAYVLMKNREFSGTVVRGLFFSGMSGIQFMSPSAAVKRETIADETVVLSACDPAMVWGAILPHAESPIPFTRVPSTVVLMRRGVPVLVAERFGERMTCPLAGEALAEAVRQFAKAFVEKRIYPDRKRITFRQWPNDAASRQDWDAALSSAGFKPEVDKRVLWR